MVQLSAKPEILNSVLLATINVIKMYKKKMLELLYSV